MAENPTTIDAMLRYESSPGVRTEAWEQGPLWGCDREGVHKNAIRSMRLHPALGSHSRKRGPCFAVRGRTWLWFAPCLAPISRVFHLEQDATNRC